MSYGDYHGPNKPDKGQEGGSCNRTLCQDSPAVWWNHGSHSWYCHQCSIDIGQDHINLRDWNAAEGRLHTGYPMFETREMMKRREEAKAERTMRGENGLLGALDDASFMGVDMSTRPDETVILTKHREPKKQQVFYMPRNRDHGHPRSFRKGRK